MGNKYPEYMMNWLRQRLGLDGNDTSQDSYINGFTKNEVFSKVLEWNGFFGYDYSIRRWIEEIYGVKLN